MQRLYSSYFALLPTFGPSILICPCFFLFFFQLHIDGHSEEDDYDSEEETRLRDDSDEGIHVTSASSLTKQTLKPGMDFSSSPSDRHSDTHLKWALVLCTNFKNRIKILIINFQIRLDCILRVFT